MAKRETTRAVFICNVVKGHKPGERYSFGEVILEGEEGRQGAYCPVGITESVKLAPGRSYHAGVLVNDRDRIGNVPWFVAEITGLVEELFDDVDKAKMLAQLGELGVASSREIATVLDDAKLVDVYTTMQELWNEGVVSRVALHRHPGSPPDGVLWATKDFNLYGMLDRLD